VKRGRDPSILLFARRGWIALLILVALYGIGGFSFFRTMYENAAFALAPSAERASAYGERHFDAERPAFYDIARAEYFYEKAVALDDQYPYVHHQLARIAFLRGRFGAALAEIDKEIALYGDEHLNSYYVRGLIEGYMGRYDEAARDYERFLESHPNSWAALNDYAWVLLKAERYADALSAADRGLANFPDNPWLLNSSAIALYELDRWAEALEAARRASRAAEELTEGEWLTAYPGNDPKIAGEGMAALRASIADNMHRIETATISPPAR